MELGIFINKNIAQSINEAIDKNKARSPWTVAYFHSCILISLKCLQAHNEKNGL